MMHLRIAVFTAVWICGVGFAECVEKYSGDFNSDCTVDANDLLIMVDHWLEYDCISSAWCGGSDIDKSDTVDFNDYALYARDYMKRSVAARAVLINEFMAANKTVLRDTDGNYPDWIELYNPGTASVRLKNWALTDDPNNKTKWLFPDVNLPARQFMIVFASDKDRRIPGSPLHTNFKLDAGGEYLAVIDPCGHVIYSYEPKFTKQFDDRSFGIGNPSGTTGYMLSPTPGAVNTDIDLEGNVSDTKFSHSRGFYTSPINVTITTKTIGAKIYYTLDGSKPSPQHGILYSSPINISRTTVLRAMAAKTNYISTNVDTQTYIFLSDIIHQTRPPQYPTIWAVDGNTIAYGDYDMDSKVVDDPVYAGPNYDYIKNDLKAIPTLCVSIDINDLFGPTGIYTNSLEEGDLWEKPVSAELIYPADPNQGFQIDCGIRILGGASRTPTVCKHSFRLLFKTVYGSSKLDYPVYGENAAQEFDTLALRAGYNNTWISAYAQKQRAQYVHDIWAHQAQRAMGWHSPHDLMVHLYLNGLYWGIYSICERPDEAFAAAYLGGQKEEYDAINSGSVIGGDKNAFNAMWSILSSTSRTPDQKFTDVQQYLNIDNFVDYMLMNYFAGNMDWPKHNWYAARKRAPGAQFYHFSWDAERILENLTDDCTDANYTKSPGHIHRILRDSPEYQLRWADRTYRHCFNGGTLTESLIAGMWIDLTNSVYDAVVCESARWGDRSTTLYTRNRQWVAERTRLLTTYFPQRLSYFLPQLRADSLYPLIDPPVLSKQGGTVSPGYQLTMTNPNSSGTIYYTLDNSDPRVSGNAYTGPVTISSYSIVKSRIRSGSQWSALNQAVFITN